MNPYYIRNMIEMPWCLRGHFHIVQTRLNPYGLLWRLPSLLVSILVQRQKATGCCWLRMFGVSTPNTHWESVFDVRRLFCLHTVFKEVPKTLTTGWIQNAPGQTHTDKYTPRAAKWSIKGTFSPCACLHYRTKTAKGNCRKPNIICYLQFIIDNKRKSLAKAQRWGHFPLFI